MNVKSTDMDLYHEGFNWVYFFGIYFYNAGRLYIFLAVLFHLLAFVVVAQFHSVTPSIRSLAWIGPLSMAGHFARFLSVLSAVNC